MDNFYKNKKILVTGGTGTLGKQIIRTLLKDYSDFKIIKIFSRDELKQWDFLNQLKQEFFLKYIDKLKFIIGDIRDEKSLTKVLEDVDIVFHTAAMKQVGSCEENPIEAVNTNVLGAINLIRAAGNNLNWENEIKIMNISTDKAVYPVNFYGMTKGLAEKLIIKSNMQNSKKIKTACCRYGNVINSRGSIIPLFKKQYDTYKKITITHQEMTRFFITIEEVAYFVIKNMAIMEGGEIFIPKMKSINILELAKSIFPDASIEITGIREGEKLHEFLLTEEESTKTEDCADMYVIRPHNKELRKYRFSFSSDRNKRWHDIEDFKKYMEEI